MPASLHPYAAGAQSLIHQVSDSNDTGHTMAYPWHCSLNPLFIRSQIRTFAVLEVNAIIVFVSIPYSSGLRFEHVENVSIYYQYSSSLNPLFIRSQIRTFPFFNQTEYGIKSLNPLFIRSQIRTMQERIQAQLQLKVSIPYSSGLRFERHPIFSTGMRILRTQFPVTCLFCSSLQRLHLPFFDPNTLFCL